MFFFITCCLNYSVARLKFVPKLNAQPALALEAPESSISSSDQAEATLDDKTTPTPRDPTKFEKERHLPLLDSDGKVADPSSGDTQTAEKFEMYEVIRGFKEPQVWLTGIGYMSLCVGLYSYSLFLPSSASDFCRVHIRSDY
ncbi:hypothetical protein PGT21_008449 [Puccinia graminis f. sp. tritici]|uniref:Uncharacterized protein n=1 Tax=Puccinia graminis f. sp. tritici TaxID=56615 RepID=A0A5B0P7Q2_PUCGR|nr:hypothetical protein PGT21_008449 [Puccinia graminis f. sp. tritici]